GSLALFAWRASTLTAGGLFHPISREGALVLNNLFLTTATATVLIGTLYPLLLEAVASDKISVGAPFFNLTFGPLMVPLLVLVPFGPLLAWKRGDIHGAAQRLMAAFAVALLAVLSTLLFVDGATVLAALGIGLGVWMVLGALTDIVLKSGLGTASGKVMLSRLRGLPRSVYGTALAHMGLGLSVLGIIGVVSFETENILTMRPGQTVELSGYTLRFDGLHPVQGPNFTEDQGRFELLDDDQNVIAEIMSSKRFYPARQMPTTEAGIRTMGLSQLYVSLGDETADGGVVVRLWWKPLVILIWFGGLVMMAAGAISLSDRRLRVGAPARRAKPAVGKVKPSQP
ncbi:MAG: cytochrome c-type biogenesis CcmF C-terminal domain-containing protein, partial [Pseudaminobacter sp.]